MVDDILWCGAEDEVETNLHLENFAIREDSNFHGVL